MTALAVGALATFPLVFQSFAYRSKIGEMIGLTTLALMVKVAETFVAALPHQSERKGEQ